MSKKNITRSTVTIVQRINHTANIFSVHFPLRFEPAVYRIAGMIAPEYSGGYWEFYTLSNGGFYMAPASEKSFQVFCENGFEGKLSGDALGISVCLYADSDLSFNDNEELAGICAHQYHWRKNICCSTKSCWVFWELLTNILQGWGRAAKRVKWVKAGSKGDGWSALPCRRTLSLMWSLESSLRLLPKLLSIFLKWRVPSINCTSPGR